MTSVPAPAFLYAAVCNRVVDGDTLDVTIDLGFRVTWSTALRVAHINAPEIATLEGVAAKAFVQAWFGSRQDCTVETYKPHDKYGRYLANVWRDGVSLGETMIAAGHAVPYEGGPR